MKATNRKRRNVNYSMIYITMFVVLAPGVASFSCLLRRHVAAGKYSDPYRYPDCGRRGCLVSPTRLKYISGASPEQYVANTYGKEGPSWWISVFGREQSSAADDYLEFLDKRYNHFLKDDGVKAESKGFNVMHWLYQYSNHKIKTAKERDALYVLGVSKLASKRFLQKHRLPTEVTMDDSVAFLGATDAEVVPNQQVTPVPIATVAAVFRHVVLHRNRLVKKQNATLQLAIASVTTSPIRAAKLFSKLFDMGGGKKSMAVTFAALAALSLLLRPILKVAASSGANTMTP